MSTRAVILDVRTHRDGAKDFRTIVERDHGWGVSQVDFEDTQQINGYERLLDFEREIRESDIIICLGNFFLFRLLGDAANRYVDALIEKLGSGVPFLVQCPRLQAHMDNGQVPSCLERFFRRCEVTPTQYVVSSEVDHYHGHGSPVNCWFRKGDDCFIHPQIFGGIDKIILSQPNLLGYEGDTFPIVEAGPLHNFATAEDLPFDGELGQKPAVAVWRQTGDEFAIVIGGFMLNSPMQTIGGALPGIDPNLEVGHRLIQTMDDAIKKNARCSEAFKAFKKLETTLGKFIREVLEPLGPLENFFPDRVRQELLKRGRLNFSSAGYSHLIEILLANWDIFGGPFEGMGKPHVEQKLKEINRGPRLYLAHPHKAEEHGFQFESQEIDAIKLAYSMISRAFEAYRSRAQSEGGSPE
jgi:hypothetical protein